jgi:hypothetical protein
VPQGKAPMATMKTGLTQSELLADRSEPQIVAGSRCHGDLGERGDRVSPARMTAGRQSTPGR